MYRWRSGRSGSDGSIQASRDQVREAAISVNRSAKDAAPSDVRRERRQQVASRLKTVEGQLRAVRRMVVEEEDCLTIATQAAAALEALRGAMKIVLRNYMDDCLEPGLGTIDREAVYDEFVGVLERFIR